MGSDVAGDIYLCVCSLSDSHIRIWPFLLVLVVFFLFLPKLGCH